MTTATIPTPRQVRGRKLHRRAPEAIELQKVEQRRLIALAQLGDKTATAQLVDSHTPLLHRWLNDSGLIRNHTDVDDLFSECVLGLLEAIRDFDLSRDLLLASYAYWCVHSRLFQERRQRRRQRLCRDGQEALEQVPARTAVVSLVDVPAAFRFLQPRWQNILRRRFGLDGEWPRTIAEIANEFHCTRGNIHQQMTRALLYLRQRTKDETAA